MTGRVYLRSCAVTPRTSTGEGSRAFQTLLYLCNASTKQSQSTTKPAQLRSRAEVAARGNRHLESCFLEVGKELLEAGASVENTCFAGTTALHAAARGGCSETIQLLLNAGASVAPGEELAGWCAVSDLRSVK